MLYIVIYLITEFCYFLITYINFIIFRYRKLKASENKTQWVILFLIYTICIKQSSNVGRYLTCGALEMTASSERFSRS